MKQPAIYILTNNHHTTLYIGVTSNLIQRIYEHKNHSKPGFTNKYNCDQLIYYEIHPTINSAIAREKQIKGGSRKKKIELINSMNPAWKDLYNEIIF